MQTTGCRCGKWQKDVPTQRRALVSSRRDWSAGAGAGLGMCGGTAGGGGRGWPWRVLSSQDLVHPRASLARGLAARLPGQVKHRRPINNVVIKTWTIDLCLK